MNQEQDRSTPEIKLQQNPPRHSSIARRYSIANRVLLPRILQFLILEYHLFFPLFSHIARVFYRSCSVKVDNEAEIKGNSSAN